jgi:hypothetical protein
MRDLYIGLFKGRSLFSRLINFWTRSEISHAGIILELEYPYKTIEVYPNGSLCRTYWNYFTLLDHSVDTIVEVYKLNVSDQEYDYAMRFYNYLAKNNVPYNWFGVIGFVIPVFTSNGGYFCSEGVVEGLKFGGILSDEIKGWKINPDMLKKLLITMKAERIKLLKVVYDKNCKQKTIIELL